MMCKGEPPVSPSCLSGTSVNKTESSVPACILQAGLREADFRPPFPYTNKMDSKTYSPPNSQVFPES